MSTNAVLVLDGNPQRCTYIKDILEFIDYEPIVCSTVDQLKAVKADQPIQAVLVSLENSASEDFDTVDTLKARFGDLPIMQLVEEGDGTATDSSGQLPCLTLPLKHRVLNQILSQIKDEDRSSMRLMHPVELFRNLVGESPGIKRIHKFIQQVADTEVNVLILGESGTGKEVVARNLHYHSRRRNRPFVPVNCGAIPSELLESELFGHEKGAFTGAICARQGRFEMADGGTLFLDEIGDMSLPMQVKLLRVLEERTFERVGSNRTIHCNVRIIAATHRRLEEEIERNRFREDLYYRLNVFPIEMPPLRDRVEDIPLLINEVMARIHFHKQHSTRLTREALNCLQHYSWPGNVRELSNLIERLAILFPDGGIIDVNNLPEKYRNASSAFVTNAAMAMTSMPAASPAETLSHMRLPEEGINLKEQLSQLEYSLIRQALIECNGVVAHAAKRLQLGRTTLVEKLRRFGHDIPESASMAGTDDVDLQHGQFRVMPGN